MAVALRVGEALEDQDADALGPAGAVGGVGERLAAAVGGEAALPAEGYVRVQGGHHGDAAGQRHGGLAGAQCLDGQVDGDQRGGAGGVDADRRAFEAEDVGDAAGHHAVGGAGVQQSLEFGDVLGAVAVAVADGADVHARLGAAQRVRVESGAFDGGPGGLQEQPLLRVHGEGLARRDAEEARVEQVRVVQEAAVAGVGRAGPLRVGVVAALQVPPPVDGPLGDGVGAFGDQVPQVLGGLDAARVAAVHAHDGDRLVLGLADRAQRLLGLAELRRGTPEVVQQLLVVCHGVTGLLRRCRSCCRVGRTVRRHWPN